MSITHLREEYTLRALNEADVDPSPFTQFQIWLDEAIAAQLPEPNAMALATASSDGTPSARMVLLRGFDERGFVFFTNYTSRKAEELERTPRAALVFYWAELQRQVRIEGTVARVSAEESDAYFQSRPRGSQIGAWASHQSSVIADRTVLDQRVAELAASYEGREIPRPSFWGGYRVAPSAIEFWQGRASRLHDRLRYRHHNATWVIERLSP